jgi:hypothetical protein
MGARETRAANTKVKRLLAVGTACPIGDARMSSERASSIQTAYSSPLSFAFRSQTRLARSGRLVSILA